MSTRNFGWTELVNTMVSRCVLDEKNQTAPIPLDLAVCDAYIQRDAMLSKEKLKD